jgi:hypothetical protein
MVSYRSERAQPPRDLLPGQAAVPRVNPVAGNPTPIEAINGGAYSARSDVFGGWG